MIDLELYRQRIGIFRQRIRKTVKNCTSKSQKWAIFSKMVWIYSYLVLGIVSQVLVNVSSSYENSLEVKSTFHLPTQEEYISWKSWSKFTGNFHARYLNGNGRNSGVRVFHLNIRKLQNKVSEIKNVIRDLRS